MRRKYFVIVGLVLAALLLMAVFLQCFHLIFDGFGEQKDSFYLKWENNALFSFDALYNNFAFDRVLIINHGYNIDTEIQTPLDMYLKETNSLTSLGQSESQTFLIFYLDNVIVYVESYDYRVCKVVFTDMAGSVPEEMDIDPVKDTFLPVEQDGYTYFVLQRQE